MSYNSGKNNPMFGKHFSVASCKKISQKLKGRKFSKQHKDNLAKNHADINGEKNPMYGVHRWGKQSPGWKGGRYINDQGYIFIYSPKHPSASKGGYVREHRLVVEKIIGRYLKSTEHIHHINKNRIDNKPQNLMAFRRNTNHKQFEAGKKVKPEDIIFDGRNL